jgi:hypothetical protein
VARKGTGVGTLLDSRKFGFIVVREALLLRTGTANDDFVTNVQRLICEERLEVAVERPAAVCKITGLSTRERDDDGADYARDVSELQWGGVRRWRDGGRSPMGGGLLDSLGSG